jgi:small subunit ribosomal protein S8
MSWSDTVADMLTRIRNAGMAKHKRVDIPASNHKEAIIKLLERERFIERYKRIDDEAQGPQGTLRVYLRYKTEDQIVISGIERVSKPGRRVYVKAKDVPRVRSGLGMAIMSTPMGIMTDLDARKNGVGGEVIARVW